MTSGESADSNAVEVDGIRFETIVPERILKLPEKKRGVETNVQFGIRITNNTLTSVRFNLYTTLQPELLTLDGQILWGGYYSYGAILARELDFPVIMPGESLTFFPKAKIFWVRRKELNINIAAGDGGFCEFRSLKAGRYQIRFTYNNKNTEETIRGRTRTDRKLIEGLWVGMVSTAFVEFCLVQP